MAYASREDVSADAALQLVGRALSESATKGFLDNVVFGSAAANDAQPAGLLNGVTPLTASTGTGWELRQLT